MTETGLARKVIQANRPPDHILSVLLRGLYYGFRIITIVHIRPPHLLVARRCIVSLEKLEQTPQRLPTNPSSTCTHSRLISDSVSVEEHKAGMVHCVECGIVIPDPHLHGESKGT